LRHLLIRNLKVRYQRSALGFLWALLNPLATIAILVTVFSYIIRIGVPDYWAFLVSGYFAWVFLLHTVTSASAVITDHSYLARGASFPTEILVFAAAGARLIEFAIELVLVMAVLAVFHHGGVPASFVLLPVLVAILTLLVLGLALPVASLAVFFHDVQHALPVALGMLAYVSPIFYPITLIPERVRDLFLLNPVAIVVSLFQGVLYGGQWPSVAHVLGAAAMATAVYLLGYAGFRRHRAFIPEIV
jgi:ABC-type polysaccharide/polyol phosphate export permease